MGPAQKVPTKLEVQVYLEKWEIDTANRMLSTNNGNNTNDENILVLSFCPVYCLRVVKKNTIGDNSLVALITFTKILFVHVLDMTLYLTIIRGKK